MVQGVFHLTLKETKTLLEDNDKWLQCWQKKHWLWVHDPRFGNHLHSYWIIVIPHIWKHCRTHSLPTFVMIVDINNENNMTLYVLLKIIFILWIVSHGRSTMVLIGENLSNVHAMTLPSIEWNHEQDNHYLNL